GTVANPPYAGAPLVLHVQSAYSPAEPGVGPRSEVGMQPTAFQKIAFVVLIALMFGVTTGLLGGL
ncbi:MAG: hypothetical protein AAGK69_11810, partial [Pseudomonadota bacterium]